MSKALECGLKGGAAAWICTFMATTIDLAIEEVINFPVVEMIAFSTAGVLAVHFGKNIFKNKKDVITSSLIAGMISTLPIVFFTALLMYSLLEVSIFGYDPWMFVLYLLGVLIGTSLLAAIPSLIGGMLYAQYVGILIGKKAIPKVPRSIQTIYCPRCRNKIEKSWISCPYCGTSLKDGTRVYDDDTRIY
jgi:xanthosine utilization system XapX-like protein